jgi:hypothetical protein
MLHSGTAILLEQLSPSPFGPAVERDGKLIPMFLRQSDLDGACGAHCVLMILVALGKLTRDQVTSLGETLPCHASRKAWSWIRRDYFVGVDTVELCKLVHLFKTIVCCSATFAKGKRAARWAHSQLARGRFVVAGMEGDQQGFDHWALVVGYEQREAGGAGRFLLLDPASDTKRNLCWNSEYQLPIGGARGIFIDGWGKRRSVQLSGAVAIYPCNPTDATPLAMSPDSSRGQRS